MSLSRNPHRGTLRGLHFQADGAAEQKLVRCVAGAIYDVALDVRKDSPTFGAYAALQLDAGHGASLFIPRGFAHGFLTLSDDACVQYIIDAPYDSSARRGYRWDDPAFAIDWPFTPRIVGPDDCNWPPYV